jgi:inner membrane transporter RhtA
MASTRFALLRRSALGLRLGRAAARREGRAESFGIPPAGLVLLSIGSVQFGAALGKQLFPALGASGAVLLRVGFAAIVLGLLWRPRWRSFSRSELVLVALYGLALAGMNGTFYAAIAHLPLGAAVTLEFVGPLGVALAGSRKAMDLAWVALAGGGIVLLAPLTGAALDPLGVALALLAGGFWAVYILVGARVGRRISGGTGLAMAMAIAAVLLLPVGVAGAGARLLEPRSLLLGAGVALLSSIIPFSLELEALRRLPTRVFGILLSLDPAAAALVGLVVLHEALGPRELAAMALIIAASIGATLENRA